MGGERRSGCQRARERRCDDARRARADAPGCAGRAAVGQTCTPPFYIAGSYCAILPDSFAITHNFFHPPPLRPQVLFRVCLGLLNTVLSQFSLVSTYFVYCKPRYGFIQVQGTASYKSLEAHQVPGPASRASSGLLYMPRKLTPFYSAISSRYAPVVHPKTTDSYSSLHLL
jgi:hypothetical protein